MIYLLFGQLILLSLHWYLRVITPIDIIGFNIDYYPVVVLFIFIFINPLMLPLLLTFLLPQYLPLLFTVITNYCYKYTLLNKYSLYYQCKFAFTCNNIIVMTLSLLLLLLIPVLFPPIIYIFSSYHIYIIIFIS